MKRGSRPNGARILATIAWMSCLTWVAVATAAEGNPDFLDQRRVVVLFDPAALGKTTYDFVDEIALSHEDSALRRDLSKPIRAKPLLTQQRSKSTQVLTRDTAKEETAEDRLLSTVVFEYEDGPSARRAMMVLSQHPAVRRLSFGVNGRYSADPFLTVAGAPENYQWGLHAIKAITPADLTGVWAKTRGSAYVAVLDNGIKTAGGTHQELKPAYRAHFSNNFGYLTNGWPAGSGSGTSFTNLDEFPGGLFNAAGHGTHVAGIVAANGTNGVGGSGVCPSCSLMLGRVSATNPTNQAIEPNPQVFDDALYTLIRRGAQVVNISFGLSNATFQDYPDVHDALLDAEDRDVVVIGASGNGANGDLDYPASDTGLVIAVGGIVANGSFWTGNTDPNDPFGSSYSSTWSVQQFVAPAYEVLSSVYTGHDWNNQESLKYCGDQYPAGFGNPGYGTCRGTSMAAPHVAGVIALMRSVNPLMSKDAVRNALAATSNTSSCTDGGKCQLGTPDTVAAVTAALGGSNVVNRKTPLFSFYSTVAQDHFYTVVPQMAMGALHAGDLVPQPNTGTQVRWDGIGSTLSGYTAFPANVCGPGTCSNTPKAIAIVFTTHVSPIGGADLVPLYRMSYRCGDGPTNPVCSSNPNHISHFYSTDEAAVRAYTGFYLNGEPDLGNPGVGYKLDGIEGYIYSTLTAQPNGSVKLCRKYDAVRDDYVLFPGAGTGGTSCAATTDGYSGGNYNIAVGGTDWIGWVLPASTAIGPTQTNSAPAVSITSPVNNTVFPANGSTTMFASASDTDGSIARVRFYVNDKLLGTDTTSPFQATWSGMVPGVYQVRAMAVDNRGAVTVSSIKTVTVNGAIPDLPNHSFENPAVGNGNYVADPNPSTALWDFDPPGAGQSGVSANNSLFTTTQTAPNAAQVAFIQGNKKMATDDVLLPFGTFKIKFRCTQRLSNYSVLGLRVSLNGAQIGNTITPPTWIAAGSQYGDCLTSSFNISAGQYDIRIDGVNDPGDHDNTAFIDNIKLVIP